jgi:glycosyltransferase involved in cell wall biosynthesis
MKRILLVSPLPPYIGGVSVSVQRLYDHLVQNGYKVDVFNTQIENRKYNYKALKFVRYLGLPLLLVFRRRYDIIHFHVSNVIPKLYVTIWRHFFPKRVKFIITIHGQVKNAFRSSLGFLSLKGFDRIICVKKGDRSNLPAEYQDRTVEIPAFIPPVISDDYKPEFPDGLEEFLNRDSFKMLLNGFIILTGSYYDLYGFKDSIQLLGKLRGKNKNADLILIVLGSDSYRQSFKYLKELKELVRFNNLESNVFWIEGSTMALWPLLKRVNVLLRPTKTDGDAMSVRESLFLNVPVVASNVVPRPEGSIVYDLASQDDFLNKTITLMENFENSVSGIGNLHPNFAQKIMEQYESL